MAMPLIMLADSGLPMILPQAMTMAIALIPIIIIETIVIRKYLGLPWGKSLGGMTIANIGSTIIGVPLSWFVMFIIEIMTILRGTPDYGSGSAVHRLAAVIAQCAWLPPDVAKPQNHWVITASLTILLIPAFVVSVSIECFPVKQMWSDIDPEKIKRAVCYANLWSYLALFITGIVLTIVAAS